MTTLLERAVAEVSRLPADQQDAVASRLMDDVWAEAAWDRALAETTDDDLDNLVAFARAQSGSARSADDLIGECNVSGPSSE